MRFTILSKIILSSAILVLIALASSGYSVYSSILSAKAAEEIEKLYLPAVSSAADLSIYSLSAMNNVISSMGFTDEKTYKQAMGNFDLLKKESDVMDKHLSFGDNKAKLPTTTKHFLDYKDAMEIYIKTATQAMDISINLDKIGYQFGQLMDNVITAANDVYYYTIDLMMKNSQSTDSESLMRHLNSINDIKIIVDTCYLVKSQFIYATGTNNVDILTDVKTHSQKVYAIIKKLEAVAVLPKSKEMFTKLRKSFDQSFEMFYKTLDVFNALALIEKEQEKSGATLEEINKSVVHAVTARIASVSGEASAALIVSVYWSFVFAAVSLILGVIIIIVMLKTVANPISRFVAVVSGLTSGDGDLTKRISASSNDKLADLALGFNKFIENVQDIIREVKSSSDEVASGNNQLAATMEELSVTFDSQTKQISDIVVNMDNISGLSKDVVNNLNESLKLLKNTTNLTHNGMNQLGDVKSSVMKINEQTDSLSKTIDNLSKSSLQIGDILTVINDIADQTNLLALNAAIEAARAGDAGRGFAVVADEVRKLAERTQKATSEIETIITSLQRESEMASKEMRNAAETVMQGVENIETTLVGFGEVVLGVEDTDKDINSVTLMVGKQYDSVQSVGDNTQVIASGIEESNAAVNEVTATVSHLQERTDRLKTLVGRFKI